VKSLFIGHTPAASCGHSSALHAALMTLASKANVLMKLLNKISSEFLK